MLFEFCKDCPDDTPIKKCRECPSMNAIVESRIALHTHKKDSHADYWNNLGVIDDRKGTDETDN